MQKLLTAVLCVPLIAAAAAPVSGQSGYQNGYYNHGNHSQFNHGAYQGGRSGDYGHDSRYYHDDHRQGGIGPGKGALIGGAGGAALGGAV